MTQLRISQKIQLRKTISWMLISMTITTLIGWYVIGWYLSEAFTVGLIVGVADRVVKTGVYYIHERFWHKKYKSQKLEANENE